MVFRLGTGPSDGVNVAFWSGALPYGGVRHLLIGYIVWCVAVAVSLPFVLGLCFFENVVSTFLS